MGVFASDISSKSNQNSMTKGIAYYFKRLGVSVLFSGAAVGVSHVVQSTRAGAEYNLALLPVVIICLVLKYPAFLFGPLYTQVVGESVIKGYSRIGKWTLPLVAFVFLGVMFTVVAAVSLLSAGILSQLIPIAMPTPYLAACLLLVSTVLGLYTPFLKMLDSMKIVFLLLSATTILVLGLALSSADFSFSTLHFRLSKIGRNELFFIAALIGWMPAGLDLPMMHSKWLITRLKSGADITNAREDFNFGYLSTAILAIVFLLVGAIFFNGKGITLAASAPAFASQLLNVYSQTLGPIAGLAMGITLFLAIYSTLFVVIDGFPRVLAEVVKRMFSLDNEEIYRAPCGWLQAAGGLVIIFVFAGSLKNLVEFATVVSFIFAPIFAFLNHKIVCLDGFRQNRRLSNFWLSWSKLGIIFFALMSTSYIYLRFF